MRVTLSDNEPIYPAPKAMAAQPRREAASALESLPQSRRHTLERLFIDPELREQVAQVLLPRQAQQQQRAQEAQQPTQETQQPQRSQRARFDRRTGELSVSDLPLCYIPIRARYHPFTGEAIAVAPTIYIPVTARFDGQTGEPIQIITYRAPAPTSTTSTRLHPYA